MLRDHDARVADAFDAMVPTGQGRAASANDYAGWQAGTTAADSARLDVNQKLTQDSASSMRGAG